MMSWRARNAIDPRTTGKKHRGRFKRWFNLQPPKSKYLIDQIVDRLVPIIEQRGFLWQDLFNFADDEPVFAYCLNFRRENRPLRESIDFTFNNSGWPYVSCDLHRVDESGKWYRADVVRWQTDYYRAKHFGIFWRSIDRRYARLARDVDWLIAIVPQMIAYIDRGEIGPNIRKWPEMSTITDNTTLK
jgi:hypothetical protein